jgi:nicotinamide mononucleotide transporter
MGCLAEFLNFPNSAETRAEIIPVERKNFFHKPDPDNTGVGENIQSQTFLLVYPPTLFFLMISITSLSYWGSLFLQELSQTSLIEWLAVGFGVAEVLLARANKVALYPAGILATLLSVYLFITSGLYAESLLNLYYIIMSVYGWWYWVKKKDKPPVPISFTNKKEWVTVGYIVAGGFIFLYVTLKNFTPSTVPLCDAFVSATAWAGMWLLAKRKIENWVLFNISNAVAIPLLFYKHLPLYAALTIFLFIIAVQGYFQWKKEVTKENPVLILNKLS